MFGQYALTSDPSDGSFRVPKLNHKKSRFGCQRCRARRVKCNEAKPVCQNCERHRAQCVYDRLPQAKSDNASTENSSPPGVEAGEGHHDKSHELTPASSLDCEENDDPPESKSRRMLEARLMHQYITATGPKVALDDKSRPLFVVIVPRCALDCDALLYAMYSLTALHSFLCNVVTEFDPLEVHRRYLAMALREHKAGVAELSTANLEVVCMTAHILRVCAFAALRIRTRKPYRPPSEWMMICGTTSALFVEAWHLTGDDTPASMREMARSTPVIWDMEARFGVANRIGLEHILQRTPEDILSEPWDAEIQDAYETTLSYIGGASTAINRGGDSMPEAQRRLAIFPMLVKKKFAWLVQEARPRALVVLAHYFALLATVEKLWWVGSVGRDEVRAIAKELPERWLPLVERPLEMIANEPEGTDEKIWD